MRHTCILLVEDDDETRTILRYVLEEPGYAVLEARNGREALQVLTQEDGPDVRLIVSDIEMPEMSGVELLSVLACNARLSRIPVIVVSGAPRARQPKSLRGIAGYLVKPVEGEHLVALARQHCPLPS